jgi:hypothetical protein
MYKYLIPVIATALLAWGAWATVGVTGATPREVFDRHVEDANKKYDEAQRRVEDKIDKIQEILIEKLGD